MEMVNVGVAFFSDIGTQYSLIISRFQIQYYLLYSLIY